MPLPEPIHFLDWTQPLAQVTAAFLLEKNADAGDGADFTGQVVVVPTRESGRRLHAALTRLVTAQNKKLSPPKILTPDACLHHLAPADNAAPDSVAVITFATVLREINPADFPALFPAEPPVRDWSWAVNLAVTLLGVKKTLGNSVAFPDFAAVATHPENAEPQRWQELAQLENAYRRHLAAQGLADAEDLRHAAANTPVVPPDWKKLWLAGTPDPAAPLLAALERAQNLEIRVIVAAPEKCADGFDAWGRIVSTFWIQRAIEWTHFDAQVRLAANPESLAAEIKKILPRAPNPGDWTTVGLLNPALAPSITQAIEAAGATAHDPSGDPASRHELGALLRLWADFLAGEDAAAVPNLLRFPRFSQTLFPPGNLTAVLSAWDELRERHLPDTLDDMREFSKKNSPLSFALEKLAVWRARFANDGWAGALHAWLDAVFCKKNSDADSIAEKKTRALLDDIREEIDALVTSAAQHASAQPADWIALLLRSLATKRITNEPDDAAVPLLGWLELLWEDAPHLVLAGLNDGVVPETVTSDPFLPGGFREKLGLPSNDTRLAQAAYVLQKLLAQRAGDAGRLDALVLQTDAQGEPLRPSRLLFLCAPSELPARVKRLFADPASPKLGPPWQAGWKFLPPVDAVTLKKFAQEIAVTRLAAYLDCPFRFYLRHVLRMEAGDAWKSEPDAREFGTAMHSALEAFASDTEIRDSSDAEKIEAFTTAKLNLYLKSNYGKNWPLPVTIMAQSAKNRLAAFARKQAQLRSDGWKIQDAEKTFEEILGAPFRLCESSAVIKGQIDRVDFHEKYGWRIIDYKTSAKAVTPLEAHIAARREGDDWPPDFAGVEFLRNGKEKIGNWINLQLPLYRHLFRAAKNVPFDKIQVAYFNLPKAISETAISDWPDYTQAMEESAVTCAQGVLANISAFHFWPPNPRVRYDEFESLLQPSPEKIVYADAFLAALEGCR